MPVSSPSSTSRPARRAASRASTRASNGCPTRRRSYSSRVWVSWYSAYQSAPASRRSRSTASGSTPGEIMTGVPVASATAATSSLSVAGSSWTSGSSPMVRSSSTTPEAARSRQISTTSSLVLR